MAVLKRGSTQQQPKTAEEQKAADENLDRWTRVSQNDIENVLLGLIVIWATAVLPSNGVAFVVCTVIFCVARLSHTVLYVLKISYGRSIAWLVGHLAIIALMIVGLVGVFSVPSF